MRAYAHAYLMRKIDDEPHPFVRVVHKIYRPGGTSHEAVDEGEVTAHTRLPESDNGDTVVMRGRICFGPECTSRRKLRW